jgi:hypothetical protein
MCHWIPRLALAPTRRAYKNKKQANEQCTVPRQIAECECCGDPGAVGSSEGPIDQKGVACQSHHPEACK